MPRQSKSANAPSKEPRPADDLHARGLHKTTHYITVGQAAFLKRKVAELKRRAPRNRKDEVTESTVIQGLLNFWMAVEKEKKSEA